MNNGLKITLGLFTIWPFLYLIVFFCAMFGIMISDFSGGGPSPGPPAGMMIILPLHLLTMFEIFALLVFYIVHVFKTDRVREDKKALWAVVLFLGYMISMPIYWYLYIWKEPAELTPERGTHGDAEIHTA